MLYLQLASTVLIIGYGEEQELKGWLHTQYTGDLVTTVFSLVFSSVSILSSRTVASRLSSVLYAITNMSLFEEALSIC